jgi:hypothetical protein
VVQGAGLLVRMSERTAPVSAEPYDAEFFIDTVCPWCWITSRWVTNVQAERNLKVRWRFISLKFLNEDRSDSYSEKHRAGHFMALRILRVCHAVREAEGNDALGRLYTAIGTAIHTNGGSRSESFVLEDAIRMCLKEAELDEAYVAHLDDESHDAPLREETELALSRTGPDVGTPIITFHPDTDRASSLFGPVIPKAPKADEAVALWDAVETLAKSGVAEIKRTLRGNISFD